MLTQKERREAITKRLNEIGCPKSNFFTARLYPVLHRLTLLPEDGADLAAELKAVKQVLDNAAIPELGNHADRVRWLVASWNSLDPERHNIQAEVAALREDLAETIRRRDIVTRERDALRASLDAERAQLAAAPANEKVRIATQVLMQELESPQTTAAELALAVLREAFA